MLSPGFLQIFCPSSVGHWVYRWNRYTRIGKIVFEQTRTKEIIFFWRKITYDLWLMTYEVGLEFGTLVLNILNSDFFFYYKIEIASMQPSSILYIEPPYKPSRTPTSMELLLTLSMNSSFDPSQIPTSALSKRPLSTPTLFLLLLYSFHFAVFIPTLVERFQYLLD